MVPNAELFANHLGDPRAGPQIGSVSSGHRSLEQNLDQRLALFFGKPARRAGVRLGGQSVHTFGFPCPLPAFDTG
jgi:hypothetical protein